MKKTIKRLMTGIVMLLLSLSFATAASAASFPTYTRGPEGTEVETQTAYEASGIFRLNLQAAEDLFYDLDSGSIYIADTGNGRILMIAQDGTQQAEYGKGTLQSPTGVSVKNDKIYVADRGAAKIFVFSMQGELMQTIDRPTEAIYGKSSTFLPTKVDVDSRGNIYCVSEGNPNGILQFAKTGEFFGYVGANFTPVSFAELVKNLFYTEEQKASLMRSVPTSPTALAVNRQGLLHTVTNSARTQAVKRLNTIGNTIVAVDAASSSRDVATDANDNMYVVDGDGFVAVYDSYGDLLFRFGGKDLNNERLGFLKNPSAIEMGADNKILVLDKDLNMVIVYTPTAFAGKVLDGTALYKDGLYVESKGIWTDILKQNSSFLLSYKVIANANRKQHNYAEALAQSLTAEDKQGYSDAFWQLRNDWLQENAGTAVLILCALWLLVKLLKLLQKKTGIFSPVLNAGRRIGNIKLLKELAFTKYMLFHPLDGYYLIKRKGKCSVLSAGILALWYVALTLANVYLTGYLFRTTDQYHVELIPLLAVWVLPVALWVGANYLVSTISNGEGSFKKVFIGTMYALSPLHLFMPPVILLTNVLTFNEQFVYDYALIAIYAWCAIYLFLMVKEIHNYEIGETVKNICVTLFTIAIIVLFAFIIYVLFRLEVDYILSIFREAVIVYGQ